MPEHITLARTSQSHPLHIGELLVGQRGGAVGVTFAPGKKQGMAMTGAWARDLDADLRALKDWGATTLISLIEPWEFHELGIDALPARAEAHGIAWYGLPIVDGAAPNERWISSWAVLGPELASHIASGGRVVVHCKGGLGRAGTVASILLLQCGYSSDAAAVMIAVRGVRPGAIETLEQEDFIRRWAAHLRDLNECTPSALRRLGGREIG